MPNKVLNSLNLRLTSAVLSKNWVNNTFKTADKQRPMNSGRFPHPQQQFKVPGSAISPGVLNCVVGKIPYVSNSERSTFLQMDNILPQAVPVNPQLHLHDFTALNEQSLLDECNGQSSTTITLTVLKKQPSGTFKSCLIERTVTNGNIQGLNLKRSNVVSDEEQDQAKKLNPGDYIVSAKLKQQAPLAAKTQLGTSPAQGNTSNPASPNPASSIIAQQVSSAPSTPLESSPTPEPCNLVEGAPDENPSQPTSADAQQGTPPRRSTLKQRQTNLRVTILKNVSDTAASRAATPEERHHSMLGIVSV